VKEDKAMHERDDSRRGAHGGADERERESQEPPRVEGCVLLVLPSSFEEGLGLLPQRPPLAVDQWVAILRREGYTAHWIPASAIEDGPYAGGIVVMATRPDDGRHYIAVPPEAVHALVGVLSPQDYRRVQVDLRALRVGDRRDDVEGLGEEKMYSRPSRGGSMGDDDAAPAAFRPVTVFWLDALAWRERHVAVPVHDPIAVGAWARTIRSGRMRVTLPPQGQPLPQDGPCPGGYVVEVDDAEGHRYFTLPREAWAVAVDLARASTQGSAGERLRERSERDDEWEEGD